MTRLTGCATCLSLRLSCFHIKSVEQGIRDDRIPLLAHAAVDRVYRIADHPLVVLLPAARGRCYHRQGRAFTQTAHA